MSPRKKFPTKDDPRGSRYLGCENVQNIIRDQFNLSSEELGKRYSAVKIFRAQYHIITCRECAGVFKEEKEKSEQREG